MNHKGKNGVRRGRATTPRAPDAPRGSRSRELRIVAGAWRGRRLRFPAGVDLRPTPDRVRETLFNWLQPHIAGSRCLDLFAGSGALGLEALSRGAAAVVFVERNALTARALEERLAQWQASGARVEHCDARRFLGGSPPQPFDIVFLDPPFAAGLLSDVAADLDGGGWLAPRALVYVECAAREGLPELPAQWRCLRSGRAGEVGYHLFAKNQSGALSA